MIKAIIMDFNGVIIDDERIQMRAYQEVLSAESIDLTEEQYFGSLGMDDVTFTKKVFERAGKKADDEKIRNVIAAKSAKWEETVSVELPLFDGIRNFVEKMAQQFSLGISSMAARKEIELVLEKAGIAKHFASIVSAEDVTLCKPDPECFKLGFAHMDAARTSAGHSPITHSQCLVIEDSPPGIVAARIAGFKALGVTNTVDVDELRKAGAGAVATDLNDWMPASIRRVFA